MMANTRQAAVEVASLGVPVAVDKLPALLRFLRTREGKSLELVADSLGWPYQSLSKYETGANHPPMDRLAMLLAFFGIHNFTQLQNAIDVMNLEPTEVPARERKSPEDEARGMLKDLQPWQRFALESMGNRLDEYEALLRELREENKRLAAIAEKTTHGRKETHH